MATYGASSQNYPRRRQRLAPRHSSAAAAAAAVVQGDGYKPREERGWEEFHPHLDIDARLLILSADDVDGSILANANQDMAPRTPSRPGIPSGATLANGVNGCQTPDDDTQTISPHSVGRGDATDELVNGSNGDENEPRDALDVAFDHSRRKRPGRPARRSNAAKDDPVLSNSPKIVPLPGPNPREKLVLPKPSFRTTDKFSIFEKKSAGQQRYVDRTMANVGYQESDVFVRPESRLIRMAEGTIEEDLDLGPSLKSETENNTALGSNGVGRVEYDMDEQDDKWLTVHNAQRRLMEVEPITREVFEITMTKIEKEWHALEKRIPKPNPKPPQTHRPRSSSAVAVNGEPASAPGEEQDSKCVICDDGDCENTNAIVFCDGCDLAVHQECYGVPFIPEGQWLCRKCQLVGRGTPTCIFCPNVDGAFKQTNSSRWSHLLCAIWIPEVTLGNLTFMEPVMDVEKVPRQRWKLMCYICRQRMGACIQCSNKNCFVAFHASCARRARLFLKMKSPQGGPASLDPSQLKAYCDKHVPQDWSRDNDVEAATAEAQDFYHHTMRGRLWSDSQQSALTITQAKQYAGRNDACWPDGTLGSNFADGRKRKRDHSSRTIWKLPSGAPVIPNVLYGSVESSLARFTIRKRKEYAAEACRYWTLKREARRGAALLKRLQLQMETFSSMEITRRNFAGMGAAGRSRLQRRIDFASTLLEDAERLRLLCEQVRDRETQKLQEARILQDVLDTIYFPITPLLWPIMGKIQSLDGKDVFREGLYKMRLRLEDRHYTTVSAFVRDLASTFKSGMEVKNLREEAQLASGEEKSFVGDATMSDHKDRRRLVKRIVKAVQGSLEDALRKEAELCGKPIARELADMELLLESVLLSKPLLANTSRPTTGSIGDDQNLQSAIAMQQGDGAAVEQEARRVSGVVEDKISTQHNDTTEVALSVAVTGGATEKVEQTQQVISKPSTGNDAMTPDQSSEAQIAAGPSSNGRTGPGSGGNIRGEAVIPPEERREDQRGLNIARQETTATYGTQSPDEDACPPTPPLSSEEESNVSLQAGGIPWYLEAFDPIGTVVHEERWLGREVVRGMSEELSEMDDEELQGLAEPSMDAADIASGHGDLAGARMDGSNGASGRKNGEKKSRPVRRWRGFR